MKISFELGAEFRDDDQGKGASRRLRHLGKVPGILYGGHREPRGLTLDHQKLLALLDNERFYSTIVNVRVGDQTQAAILKDVQRHPARNAILHVDLQRVVETEKIRIRIPLHFHGEAISRGVKEQGGIVSHQKTEVDVSCLPNDLPEFVEVDVSGLSLNQSLHLSDLKAPQGVTVRRARAWPRRHGRLGSRAACRGAGADGGVPRLSKVQCRSKVPQLRLAPRLVHRVQHRLLLPEQRRPMRRLARRKRPRKSPRRRARRKTSASRWSFVWAAFGRPTDFESLGPVSKPWLRSRFDSSSDSAIRGRSTR